MALILYVQYVHTFFFLHTHWLPDQQTNCLFILVYYCPYLIK